MKKNYQKPEYYRIPKLCSDVLLASGNGEWDGDKQEFVYSDIEW